MMSRTIVATCVLAMLAGHITNTAAAEVDFNRDVRPILAKRCFACHGPDQEAREAELRLDTAAGAMRDLGDYRAVEPGAPEASELIKRVRSMDPDQVMPPPDSGDTLSAEEQTILRKWIANGARYDIHWSFKAPARSELPSVEGRLWPRNPIDHFVLARLEAAELAPTPEANRYQLIRRASLDLTGLPPTPEQADAFAADTSSDAFEKMVDRLLASNAYGERWARMWLDLARYADTMGYEKDRPRNIWRYRDWVIDALNRDMPFDQFTIEQLAGDLLPAPTTDQLLATAFHRNTMTNEEGGTDNEEFRVAAVKDRVDTTMQVWMGLTMGCAKCHSHKYDPVAHDDYYAFYAFFNQTEDADRGNDTPVAATPTQWNTLQIREMEAAVQQLQARLRAASPQLDEAFRAWLREFETGTPWNPLGMSAFSSQHGVTLLQRDDGTLVASGEVPEKDVWTLTLDLPANVTLTSLRLDVFPKAIAGGSWPDRNAAIREISVSLLQPEAEPRPWKLVRPRADFSQDGWAVGSAIDGKPDVGWGFHPNIEEPHVAIFDFETPITANEGSRLRLTLDQRLGEHQLLARFRVSVSNAPSQLLEPDVDFAAGLKDGFARHVFPTTRTLHQTLDARQATLAAARQAVPRTPVMRELTGNKRRDTRVHQRGNFLDLGDSIEPQVPEIFGTFPERAPANRLGIAQWILQPENPLTSRVMVNRVWARIFGKGIVETEEDFGTQGSAPTHQNMLDWLAVDFREQGWSLKRLLRTIVCSSTYRQSAAVTKEKLAKDPRNALFSRGPRFRLPAETVRDQALTVSGLLTRTVGGPSVMPPQPEGVWKSTYSALKWQDAVGADRYRRALYTYWKRTSPYPAMLTFDAGSGEVCQVRRVRTNTPLQALVTLNDPAFVEAAGALAVTMSAVEGEVENKVRRGFRLVLTRPATEQEVTRLASLYESLTDDFDADPQAAQRLVQSAGLSAGDAAMIGVANVLLNLDATLMK